MLKLVRLDLVAIFVIAQLFALQVQAQLSPTPTEDHPVTPSVNDEMMNLEERPSGAPNITEYSTGLDIQFSVSTDVVFKKTAGYENGRPAPKSLISALEDITGSLRRYNLHVDEFSGDANDPDFEIFLEFKLAQRVHNNIVSTLNIVYSKEVGAESAWLYVEGQLLEPLLPELDPSNWMAEVKRTEKAVSEMRAFVPPRLSEAFESNVRNSTVSGRITFDIQKSPAGMSVSPVYRVRENGAAAEINLYTKEVKAYAISVKKSATQVKTSVCEPVNDPFWPNCVNNSSASHHPQVQTVFGEDNNGNSVCTSDPPFNLPTSTQCSKASYQSGFYVVKNSEDLLSSKHPAACCSSMGQWVTVFGQTFRQLDVMIDSADPSISQGAAAYFNIQGSPARAMILVDDLYTNSSDSQGWPNLLGHEWAHGYGDYYGKADGLKGDINASEITLGAISEGLADTWAAILYKERYANSWNWIFKFPNGNTSTSVSGGEDWGDYSHSTSALASNGEIFTAIFRRMVNKGVSTNNVRLAWMRMTRFLTNSDSSWNDGIQGTASVNIFDFAERFRLSVNSFSSGQRKAACEAWEDTDVSPSGYPAQVCNAETPDNQTLVWAGCSPENDPAGLWIHNWDNGDFLSWTEVWDSENAGLSWQLNGFLLPSTETFTWRAQNIAQGQGLVRLRSCRWNLKTGSKVCSGYTPSLPAHDPCSGG